MLLAQVSDVCNLKSKDDRSDGCSLKGSIAFSIHDDLVRFGEAACGYRPMMFNLAPWLGKLLFWRAGVVFNDLQVGCKFKHLVAVAMQILGRFIMI